VADSPRTCTASATPWSAPSPPNPFGLYDVHGNVWEWCQDWYQGSHYRENEHLDPSGPFQGESKVMRGGSWFSTGRSCRSGHSGLSVPGERNHTNGFRVAMTVEGRNGTASGAPTVAASSTGPRRSIHHCTASPTASAAAAHW
jgi:formylglycine-generating enzyme required for sulfatase activity